MFGLLVNFGGGFGNTGNQVRGFGFSHDGSVDTLFRFVSGQVFAFNNDIERRDVEAFMLAFDTDLAPIVGQQVTLTQSNTAEAGARIDLLLARAGADFTSLVLGGDVVECDLVAKVSESGTPQGFVYDPDTVLFMPDTGGPGIGDSALRDKATLNGDPVTYTCVPPGSGERVGVDRDDDALGDGAETDTGTFNGPMDAGTDPLDPDTDGDGFEDGVEVAAGTNPLDPLDFPQAPPFVPPVPALPPLGLAVLAGLLAGTGLLRARRA
jgi:hypothetical protein